MGKGIALEYRYRYPEMFEKYAALCKRRELRPGNLFLWKEEKPWILNFPTKDRWKAPSKMEYIEEGLRFFAKHYVEWGVKSIAFPHLGTTHGRLSWEEVRNVMYNHLEPLSGLDVEIYELNPDAKDHLFEKFKEKIKLFTLSDYLNRIQLSSSTASKLSEAVRTKRINSMRDIQNLDGFGEQSIIKVYKFLRTENGSQERQVRLNF